LRNDRHNAHNHLVCLGHVRRQEAHASLLQAEQERRIAAQAVELGDDKGRVVQPATRQRLDQLRPLVVGSALNFNIFRDQRPSSAIQEVPDGLALRVEPEPGLTLFGRRDAGGLRTDSRPSHRTVWA